MRIDDEGPADPQGRHDDDPPAHLPRGQLLRRHPARLAVGAGARRRRLVPANQTPTPVQLDQILTSLQSDTREDLQLLLREFSEGFDGQGGAGFNRSIQYWEGATRTARSSTTHAGQDEARPLRLHRAGRAPSRGARPQPGRSSSASSPTSTRPPRRSPSTSTEPRAGDRRAPAHAARRPAGARRAQRQLPAAAALRRGPPARHAVLDAGDRRVDAARDASSTGSSQATSCAGSSRTCGPPSRSLAKLNVDAIPLHEQVRAASSCQNEVILPWTQGQDPGPDVPRHRRSSRRRRSRCRGLAGESRSGDANGQWFRVLRNGGPLHAAARPTAASC